MSKLTCEPYEEKSVADQLAVMNTRLGVEEKTTLLFNEHLVKFEKFGEKFHMTCPTENSNYVALNDVCYFFDNQARSYQDAQQNCKITCGVLGYLFEPFSNAEAKTVYNLAKPVLGTGSSDYWIGLDNIGRGEDSLYYRSNGAPKSQLLTASDFDTVPVDYGATIESSAGVLEDEPITGTFYSICQYTFL